MRLKYFKVSDFACPCCGKNFMSKRIMKSIDKARGYSGFPYIQTSCYRCEKHNKKVWGKVTSAHIKGLAIDLKCESDEQRWIMIRDLKRVGFTRFGIGKNFIHADKDKDKNGERIWVY